MEFMTELLGLFASVLTMMTLAVSYLKKLTLGSYTYSCVEGAK